MTDRPEAADESQAVVGSLWRAIAIPRFVTLAHAVVVNLVQWEGFRDPSAGWLVVTAVAVWTLISTWAYDDPRRPKLPVLCVDLAVAVGALAVGRFIAGPELLADGATIPGFWVVSPVLAWAIHRGWPGGVLSALVVAAADWYFRTPEGRTSETIANVFLMLLAGGVLGYCSTLVRETAAVRARAAELAARTAERERLARVVHDGVLQVLAYVQRRGAEIGGQTLELARAAGEQEEILRALVQGNPETRDTAAGGTADVGPLVGRLAGHGVSVAAPAEPVLLRTEVAEELVAAAKAALDNCVRHAAGSKVYLLLEDEEGAVTVSVRDDGPGIPVGRLDEAAAAGRMGVSRSIVGRLEALGGTATVTTGAGRGTEWELRIPRTPAGN